MMMMSMAFVCKSVTRMIVLSLSLSMECFLEFLFVLVMCFQACTAWAGWEDVVSVGANLAGRMMHEVRLGRKPVGSVNRSSYAGLNLGEIL